MNSSIGKQRDTNIEMLRIVAMLMIVMGHMGGHGILHAYDKLTYYTLWDTGSCLNKIWLAIIDFGGNKGVAIFFMITGYFLINNSDIKLQKIVLQTTFYGLLFLLLSVILSVCGYSFPGIHKESFLINIIRSIFLPVTSGMWWFVTAYCFLMLCHPLVNKIAAIFNKKGYLIFLGMYYIFWYSLGIFCDVPFLYIQKAIFFYLIGGYIRIYKPLSKPNQKCVDNSSEKRIKSALLDNLGGVLILVFLMGWVFSSSLLYLSSKLYFNKSLKNQIILMVLTQLDESVAVPLCSIALFLLFISLNIKYSPIINKIASCTFGIYLFHNNPYMRPLLWHTILKVDTFQYQSIWFPILSVLSGIIIFAAAICVDLIRGKYIEPIQIKIFNCLKNRCIKNLLAERE